MIEPIIETYFFNGQYAPDRRKDEKNHTPFARRVDDETPKESTNPYRVPVNKFLGKNLDISV